MSTESEQTKGEQGETRAQSEVPDRPSRALRPVRRARGKRLGGAPARGARGMQR